MHEQIALTTDWLMGFPQRLRSTYTLWQIEEDLHSTLPKATYYRHRKELLPYGIDIAIRQESTPRSNVAPLVRVLRAEPAQILIGRLLRPWFTFQRRIKVLAITGEVRKVLDDPYTDKRTGEQVSQVIVIMEPESGRQNYEVYPSRSQLKPQVLDLWKGWSDRHSAGGVVCEP